MLHNSILPNPLSQYFWHYHGTIFLLIVFNYRYKNSGRSHHSVVKRVRELKFSIGRAVPYIQTTCLKIVEVRRRVSFSIFLLRGNPGFQIVFFYLPKAKVSPAIYYRVVMQIKGLEYFFSVFGKLFMPLYRLLMIGLAENYLYYTTIK